ncbi:hypothetical protein BX616_000970 [Lobosporangium transversale]|uniref:Uncharacterized protein n=1 Tax=Lobosporangium transversale TaxID=64571 RepID=A0A1Y2GD45_9FUNG|nr:hypothetical protein BCR41DRAFT_373598 [Lobosporangium transversale]KAF9905599.1 hypothetical protein BX616_000970 [Lobosporangium transversale]ORZ07510.1 hypothetical protein BCR41DRAFT_373598 [Lobosporangium transversale]|eukprot:XP_021878017.1 hypothetical protein BCR41DRAFT_373598 [Lobosporangium transversale]
MPAKTNWRARQKVEGKVFYSIQNLENIFVYDFLARVTRLFALPAVKQTTQDAPRGGPSTCMQCYAIVYFISSLSAKHIRIATKGTIASKIAVLDLITSNPGLINATPTNASNPSTKLLRDLYPQPSDTHNAQAGNRNDTTFESGINYNIDDDGVNPDLEVGGMYTDNNGDHEIGDINGLSTASSTPYRQWKRELSNAESLRSPSSRKRPRGTNERKKPPSLHSDLTLQCTVHEWKFFSHFHLVEESIESKLELEEQHLNLEQEISIQRPELEKQRMENDGQRFHKELDAKFTMQVAQLMQTGMDKGFSVEQTYIAKVGVPIFPE